MTEVEGIDHVRVANWFAERIPDLEAPLTFEPITGGLSNLTFGVTESSGRRWVLRRPPLGHVLATAHDMAREARILRALATTDVPVPVVLDTCDDDTVNGAPFYVMEFVEGLVAGNADIASSLPIEARVAASRNVIDVLGTIHEVDVDAVGFGDLGRRESYVERQLSRWQRQWEATADAEVPEITELHRRLTSAVPTQHGATIVHGDYRIENCILRPDGSIAAVLDWELCTLGDPLADLGFTLVYWGESTDTLPIAPNATTTLEGFASRSEIIEYYARRTGRDVDAIGYYVALGYWKLACILQGVLVRYRSGAMGDTARGDGRLDGQVASLGRLGLAALAGTIGRTDG